MPKLSSLQLLERIEKRLRDLESGIDNDAREIYALISPTQRKQLKAAWQAQRKLKRPTAFTTYETKHVSAGRIIFPRVSTPHCMLGSGQSAFPNQL